MKSLSLVKCLQAVLLPMLVISCMTDIEATTNRKGLSKKLSAVKSEMNKLATEWPLEVPTVMDITRACCVTDLLNQILICCQENGACCDDLSVTVSVCCFDLQNAVGNVELCCDNVTVIVTDLADTLSACCTAQADCCDQLTALLIELGLLVEQDFNETWTILAALQDCCDAQALCCEELTNDFNETWTILAACCDAQAECCAVVGDLTGTSSSCFVFNSPADVDAAQLTVIDWLKTIYRGMRVIQTSQSISCADGGVWA